jgi:hypothetical protein
MSDQVAGRSVWGRMNLAWADKQAAAHTALDL